MVEKMDNSVAEKMESYEKDVLQYLVEARQGSLNKNEDFDKQQALYTKYAHFYDNETASREYNAPKFAAIKIMELYPNQKDIKILDYGCGTGLFADCLSEYGYTNIDGLDPCKEITDVARSKGRMRNFFELRSEDDDSVIPSDEYDVVCSSGVLYCSPSHPGFECIPKICRYVKPGGYIVTCTGESYFKNVDVSDYSIIDELAKEGKLRIEPKKILENYRIPMHGVEGETAMQGALLVYHVL